MDGINQFAISRILGSTMKHMKRPSFGPLGAMHARNQVLTQCPRPGEQIAFAPSTDKRIARAFEETRQGFPLDRFLADPGLVKKFFERCRDLEVIAPDHALALRLLTFRKSPKKYPKLVKPAAAKEKRRDFSAYVYAAEMALTQVKYRYGASVDDILAYPEIGKEFDKLAQRLYPGMTPLDYRLAALHVRKCLTTPSKGERPLFERIKTADVERKARDYGPLARLDIDKLNRVEGIIGLIEHSRREDRFLYIRETEDASQAAAPFTQEKTFVALGNSFWSPSLSAIRLLVYDIHQQSVIAPGSLWAKKLIAEKGPIFNYIAA